MRIVFFGSDDFARAHLDALGHSEHEVAACVTQPDKPQGRGLNIILSPIKEYALLKNILCLQPEDFKNKDIENQLKELKADLFVVIAYGKILPLSILEIPQLGSINVHGSLLPKYRGAAPINWAIINGEKRSGLTIIKMNTQMDAGDILGQYEIAIDAKDTSVTLRAKMIDQGPAFLLRTMDAIEKEKIVPIVQKDEDVTMAPKLSRDLGQINWKRRAEDVHNLVRGLLPWPAAFTFFQGKMLKVLESEVLVRESSGFKEGEVMVIDKSGITVACMVGAVLIKKVHLESSKAMDAKSFADGFKIKMGFKF